MTQTNEQKRSRLSLWVARICALVVLMSCFASNDAINHDELAWYQKIAFGIVFVFGLFGSVTWIRSTYSPAELKASQESPIVKVSWWVLIGAVVFLMLAFTLARMFG